MQTCSCALPGDSIGVQEHKNTERNNICCFCTNLPQLAMQRMQKAVCKLWDPQLGADGERYKEAT